MRWPTWISAFALLALFVGVLACGGREAESQGPVTLAATLVVVPTAPLSATFTPSPLPTATPEPTPVPTDTPTPTHGPVPIATATPTLTVGTVTATKGQLIEVPVTLDVDVPIRGIHLNLVYGGNLLQSGIGKRGAALPEGWQVFSNEPSPGDLRIMTLSFGGDSFLPDEEPVLLANFSIAPDAPYGHIPISVALLDVSNSAIDRLDLAIVNGTVMVTHNPGCQFSHYPERHPVDYLVPWNDCTP